MTLETFLLEEYWYGEQPKKCRGCECSEKDWDFEGRVFWGCDQDSCYRGI